MADIHALGILSDRKKAHGKFSDLLKSKEKLEILNLNRDVSNETEISSKKIDEIKEYISNIHIEMQALVALLQTFTIQLSEEMKMMMAEGLFEEENDERKEGPSAKKGVMRFINVSLSKIQVSQNSSASVRQINKEKLEKLATFQKMAKQQQDLQEFMNKTSEMIQKIENETELGTQDIKDINKALHEWSDGLEEEKDRKERKRREREEEKRKAEEEKRQKIEEERKKKEREKQKRIEEAEKRRKEAEEKERQKNEERKRKEEAERKRKEEERRIEEEEKKRQREEEERIKREKEERQRKEEEDKKRKEEEERKRNEEEIRKIEEQRQKEAERRRQEEEERRRREEEEIQKRKKEEKRKREEEERLKKEAEERRRKEEEEEKRAKEEKRRKEELKKKEEAERKRKDPNNWPIFIYHREEGKNSFHCGICCVVSAIENNPPLLKDDLICSFSDKPQDLNKCMESKEEILMSSLIQIQVKNDIEMSFELPLRIYIPHAILPANRDIVLKVSINDGKWVSKHNVLEPTTNVSKVLENLAGGSFQNFKRIKLIAVSKIRREHMTENGTSSCVTSKVNSDISIGIPGNHLKKDTSFHLKVDDEHFIPRTGIQSEGNHIMMATPLLGVDFDDVIENDYVMGIQPNYVKKTVFNTMYPRVLHECSQKLATDMAIDEILQIIKNKNLLSDETINNIRSKNTNEMKVRALLDEFKDCNAEAFENMLETIERANQGHLANYLRDWLDKIQNEEAEVGNDFIDFTQPVLQIASSVNNGKWEVVDLKSTANLPNAVNVPLPAHGQSFDILGLVVPKAMTRDGICSKAEEIYRGAYQTLIRLIVRQHVDDPTDVYIRCVEASKSHAAQHELENEGYKSGPTEMAEFGICDNEDIFLTATGNIAFVSNPNPLKFFLNFDIASLQVKVNIQNKYAQSGCPKYYGEVKYNVGEQDQKPPRSGSFVVYLPKEAEFQRYAPLALDIPVKAMAKFIALHVTSGKFDIQDLYSRLTDNPRQLRSIKLRAQKEDLTGTERKICEAFIKNWANVRPKQENKVDTLLRILKGFAPNLAQRAEDFIKLYTAGKGAPLANTGIEEMSNLLKDKWKDLASKLNFEEDEIKAMVIDIPDEKRRALHVLDKWRLSDFAIEQDTNVVRYLYNVMLDCGCNQNLLSMLQQHL
ncbi:uncharacterized protein LOC130051310 [Ostrea edulis]|uniref:uncharacterized protein LOC130051310 n=1 Tax=Ostrea edulis TaxID=37623 RepID=UPI0024AF107A|nr:uncharacterized protein LOC130051310 [Ostrea edulis]